MAKVLKLKNIDRVIPECWCCPICDNTKSNQLTCGLTKENIDEPDEILDSCRLPDADAPEAATPPPAQSDSESVAEEGAVSPPLLHVKRGGVRAVSGQKKPTAIIRGRKGTDRVSPYDAGAWPLNKGYGL
jgi:hypothetical protein